MKARVQGYPRYYHMWAHLHIGAVCKSTSYRRALEGVDFRSPFKKKGFLMLSGSLLNAIGEEWACSSILVYLL